MPLKYNRQKELQNALSQKTALLVIDVQNDFCASNGVIAKSGRPIKGIQAALKPIRKLQKAAHNQKIPVVFTRLVYDLKKLPQSHAKRMKIKKVQGLCCPNSKGIEFFKITPARKDIVIEKNFYSAFFRTGLEMFLQKNQIKTLILTGVTTQVCPLLTAADAYYRGYRLVALTDALGTYDGQDWALSYMKEQFAAQLADSSEIMRVWKTQK